MIRHCDIDDAELRIMLNDKSIQFAGHRRLKIYGTLHCKSGKRMGRQQRVFFASEDEAVGSGYRPCAHCIKDAYTRWISWNR